MDITPALAEGSLVIEAYGDGGFRVAGRRIEGSIIITPHGVYPWEHEEGTVSLDSLQQVVDCAKDVDILLVGCGSSLQPLPVALKNELRELGVGSDPMDTGAACRTYNVLLTEDRRVAVALKAID